MFDVQSEQQAGSVDGTVVAAAAESRPVTRSRSPSKIKTSDPGIRLPVTKKSPVRTSPASSSKTTSTQFTALRSPPVLRQRSLCTDRMHEDVSVSASTLLIPTAEDFENSSLELIGKNKSCGPENIVSPMQEVHSTQAVRKSVEGNEELSANITDMVEDSDSCTSPELPIVGSLPSAKRTTSKQVETISLPVKRYSLRTRRSSGDEVAERRSGISIPDLAKFLTPPRNTGKVYVFPAPPQVTRVCTDLSFLNSDSVRSSECKPEVETGTEDKSPVSSRLRNRSGSKDGKDLPSIDLVKLAAVNPKKSSSPRPSRTKPTTSSSGSPTKCSLSNKSNAAVASPVKADRIHQTSDDATASDVQNSALPMSGPVSSPGSPRPSGSGQRASFRLVVNLQSPKSGRDKHLSASSHDDGNISSDPQKTSTCLSPSDQYLRMSSQPGSNRKPQQRQLKEPTSASKSMIQTRRSLRLLEKNTDLVAASVQPTKTHTASDTTSYR